MFKSKSFQNILRLVGIIVALGVAVTSVLLFVFSPFTLNVFNIIACVYLVIFSLLAVAGELKIVFVIQWFKFMANYFGFGLFYVFIGLFLFRGSWWAFFVGAVAMGLGVIYIICFAFGLDRNIDVSDKAKKAQNEQAVKYATNTAAEQAAAQNTSENRQRLAENGGKANPFDNDNPFQGGNAY